MAPTRVTLYWKAHLHGRIDAARALLVDVQSSFVAHGLHTVYPESLQAILEAIGHMRQMVTDLPRTDLVLEVEPE